MYSLQRGPGHLFERPDLYVLHIEILLLGEHGVAEGLTGVAPAVVEISIQPQTKLPATGRENNVKATCLPGAIVG